VKIAFSFGRFRAIYLDTWVGSFARRVILGHQGLLGVYLERCVPCPGRPGVGGHSDVAWCEESM